MAHRPQRMLMVQLLINLITSDENIHHHIMFTYFINILTDLLFTGLTDRSCSVGNSTGHVAIEVTEHSCPVPYQVLYIDDTNGGNLFNWIQHKIWSHSEIYNRATLKGFLSLLSHLVFRHSTFK